jgi:hypothetical protein
MSGVEFSRIKVGEGNTARLNTPLREEQAVGDQLWQGLLLEFLKIVTNQY